MYSLMYELFNLLQWQPSTSSDIQGYYIFRNDVLIATVSPSTTSYQDHNQPKSATTTYSVQAFHGAGTTSLINEVQFINGVASPVALG